MKSKTSSLRAYGLRAQSGRTACSVAAIVAGFAAAPAFAIADHDGMAYAGVISKKDDGDKPGRGNGKGNNGNGKGNGGPAPAAPVQAPAVTPAPRPAAPQAPKPAPTQAPRPAAPQAPTQAPRPAAPQAPKPAPTQAPRPAAPQAPKPAPTQPPTSRPAPTQATPEPARQAPGATPGRPSSPAPTPDRGSDDRASGEGRDDRSGVGVGVAPGSSGSGPAVAVPEAPSSSTPGPVSVAGPAPVTRGRRAPAPSRATGGLVDMADRAGGGGRGSRSGNAPSPSPDASTNRTAPVAYREQSNGRRVYAVPATDGTRRRREVSVPGGVFGILPSAAMEATAEVAGAREEGRTRGGSSSGSNLAAPTGVTETLSRPLDAIDEVTGGSISPLLVVGALAAMAVALGFGIRRELHRW